MLTRILALGAVVALVVSCSSTGSGAVLQDGRRADSARPVDAGRGPLCPVDAGRCPAGTVCAQVTVGPVRPGDGGYGNWTCMALTPGCEAGPSQPCRCGVCPGACTPTNDAGTAVSCSYP